jgi:hypothetical protein
VQTSALPLGYRALAQLNGKEVVLRFVKNALTSDFAGRRQAAAGVRRIHAVFMT